MMIAVLLFLLFASLLLSGLTEGLFYGPYSYWHMAPPFAFGGPISTGSTRNQSYDIRGDPYIPRVPTGPWNQSTIGY